MDTLVRPARWGDDFSLCGRRSLCNAFQEELGKHLLVKTTAVMGPNVEMGDVQEAIHLNRLLRLYPPGAEGGERWELEADPRHVDILVSQMARSLMQRIELATDRGRCGPAICQDRCELQFTVKELARRMQQPNTKSMQTLERLVQFLKGSPRCLVVYNRRAEQPIVDVFPDSNWAGCAKTRRSTSSSCVMLGGHLLSASATTQNVVATSSGEA